jgi:hypothetical protein
MVAFSGILSKRTLGQANSDVAPPQGVLPMDTAPMLDSKHASDHVFIVVGVVQVGFKDGTTWTADAGDFMLHHARVAGKSTGIVPVSMQLGGAPQQCGLCWFVVGKCMPQNGYSCMKTDFGQCKSMPCDTCNCSG